MAHPTNRKWVIAPVINGISKVNPLITGVITHLRFVGSSPPSTDQTGGGSYFPIWGPSGGVMMQLARGCNLAIRHGGQICH